MIGGITARSEPCSYAPKLAADAAVFPLGTGSLLPALALGKRDSLAALALARLVWWT